LSQCLATTVAGPTEREAQVTYAGAGGIDHRPRILSADCRRLRREQFAADDDLVRSF
jgi:hypothetical protein